MAGLSIKRETTARGKHAGDPRAERELLRARVLVDASATQMGSRGVLLACRLGVRHRRWGTLRMLPTLSSESLKQKACIACRCFRLPHIQSIRKVRRPRDRVLKPLMSLFHRRHSPNVPGDPRSWVQKGYSDKYILLASLCASVRDTFFCHLPISAEYESSTGVN